MKEGTFHFYKVAIQPKLEFIKKNLLFYSRNFSWISRLLNKQTLPIQPILPCRYLLIKDSNNFSEYKHYESLRLNPEIIEKKTYESLNLNTLYFVLGTYENIITELVHLRNKGFKVFWDQYWMKPDNHKPIWKRRVSVVEAIYTDLMTESIEIDDQSYLTKENPEWLDDFENLIFRSYLTNKEEYRSNIDKFLKEGWDWSRINLTTIAIILEAMAEYRILKTPAAVLISQSVKTAKNYCGDEDYKIINALLENYFRSCI